MKFHPKRRIGFRNKKDWKLSQRKIRKKKAKEQIKRQQKEKEKENYDSWKKIYLTNLK